MNVRFPALGFTALLLTASPAGRCDPDAGALAVGERVRIQAAALGAKPVTGSIVALDAQGLTVKSDARPEPVRIARTDIARLELSAGPGSRIPGAAIGALAGGLLGALAVSRSGGTHIHSADQAAIALGAVLGGGIGAAVPPGERWREAPLPARRVSFVLRPGPAPVMAVAVRF